MTAKLGKRTSAVEALQGVDLSDRTVIVTGASSGIGIETARALASAGADVTLACRSIDAGEKVAEQVRASVPRARGKVSVRRLDLEDLGSVRSFSKAWIDDGRPLDLLVNNAGIMAPPFGATAYGIERQMGTNHLGHFVLTTALLPLLERSPAARVVNVSSELHRRGTSEGVIATLDDDPRFEKRSYSRFGAYGDSKLANVLFTRALAKRAPSVVALALHPGVIPTNLSRSFGPLSTLVRGVLHVFSKSISQGAATSVYAATAPELSGRTGAYLEDCAERHPSRAAQSDSVAEQVWELSERRAA